MVSTFAHQVETQPSSVALILVNILIYLYQFDHATPAAKFGQEYERQLRDGEWWRVVSSTFSHLNALHIFLNMSSLWYLAGLEAYLGTAAWLRYTLLLVLLTNVLLLGMQWAIRRYRPVDGPQYTAGYSGVLFGYFAMQVLFLKPRYMIFGWEAPGMVMLFLMLLVAQFLMPNVSFTGHLSGIIVGLLIGAGAFDWFGNYLALCLLFWTLVLFVATLKTSGAAEFRYITIPDANDPADDSGIRMVRGEIVHQRPPPALAHGDDQLPL